MQSAKARAERARKEVVESPLRHLPQIEQGRQFLDEIVARTLQPHEDRQHEKAAALHMLWEKHVYVPIREQLQRKRAGDSFSMHEEHQGSAVHRSERGQQVLSSAESRASIEQVDPNHAHAFKIEREKSILGSTSHALVLARRHGAIVHADGSYELPAPRTLRMGAPLPHELLLRGRERERGGGLGGIVEARCATSCMEGMLRSH